MVCTLGNKKKSKVHAIVIIYIIHRDANMKIKSCTEGHICDSDCQKKKECPCNEHRHTVISELGQMGGKATFAKYGKEHFSKIAKGWPKGKKRKAVDSTSKGNGLEK